MLTAIDDFGLDRAGTRMDAVVMVKNWVADRRSWVTEHLAKPKIWIMSVSKDIRMWRWIGVGSTAEELQSSPQNRIGL